MPRQMSDHTLDPLKGWLPGNMAALDCSGKLSAEVTIDPVYAGRVVHKNNDGEFEMGVTGTQMPIFLFQNSDDPDVSNPGGDNWTPIRPTGNMSGIVATAGVELASTEYDATQTYSVNDVLRAIASNSNATTGGRLTNAGFTLGTTAGVGVVSKTPYAIRRNRNAIAFWAAYIPGTD